MTEDIWASQNKCFLAFRGPEQVPEMLCEKTEGHASYTNAQCENANVKLDSPQSESDRGESQLKMGRAT